MFSLCLLILPLYFLNTGAFYTALLFLGMALCGRYMWVYYVCQLKNGGVERVQVEQVKKYFTANASKPQKCEYVLRVFFRNGKTEPMVLEGTDLLLKNLRHFPGFVSLTLTSSPASHR